jgi:two-component system CheB/CheR fusion protein
MDDTSPAPARPCPLAVIGASAGGVEALTELVAAIRPDTRLAYVVVQHLAANQRSILHELLQAHCAVPVTRIEADERIEPSHVYVVPPGKSAVVDGDRLRLLDRDPDDVPFKPIDHCFESLAASHGRDGYCVVLSGTGSDGAAGLRAVKEAGGISIAQESETARFPGMPDAAVSTGLVDFVLPSPEIVPRLEEIVDHCLLVDDDEIRARLHAAIAEALPRIVAILREATGQDFADYKPGTMTRRIERRMGLMRIGEVDRFVETLAGDAAQATHLGQEFLVGVTRFFRDPEAFEALRLQVIEPLVERADGPIRVWVPGCSTGEEAYTLAMLLTEAIEARARDRGAPRPKVQIFGTDLDSHALTTARRGIYPAAAMAEIDPARRDRFFAREGGGYRAGTSIREICVFAPHNLVQDAPFSRLDLISCRNVMIYLSAALQRRVLPRFHFSLRRSGYLFLGASEGVASGSEMFRTLDKGHRIFQRDDRVSAGYSSLRDPRPQSRATGMPALTSATPSPEPVATPASREIAFEREFLQRFAAPFAVVTRGGEVRYLSQGMTTFARPAQGAPSSQIEGLLPPALSVPVRMALDAAGTEGRGQSVEGVLVQEAGAPAAVYDIAVSPARPEEDEFFVVLAPVRPVDASGLDLGAAREDGDETGNLKAENIRLNRRLTETSRASDAANQELKSYNEELMSMNEELQSSNEELDTSREELESTNEELETINAELRENNRQLTRANSDLANLYESTDLAVLFLDRAFAVRNYTPATTALYAIKPRDIGRPIADLSTRLDYDRFAEDAARVDADLQAVEREVRVEATDQTFLLRMKPYRTTDNRIDGYVLAFVDITGRKRNEEVLERQRRDLARQYAELENIYDITPVGLALIDRDLRYLRINEKMARIDGVPVDAYEGRTIPELTPQIVDRVAPTFERVFETGEAVLGLEVSARMRGTDDSVRHFIADYYPVIIEGEVYAVGTCVREVSEQKRLIAELAESEARMQRTFDASPVFIVITSGPEHTIAYSNPANMAVTGNRAVPGRRLADALPELEGQEVIDRFTQTFETGERQVFPEFRVDLDRSGDGTTEEIWFMQVIEPQRDGAGAIIGVVSFAYEITEQVRARKAAQESEAQTSILLAELQHRVKNTLATVRALSRFLLAGSADAAEYHQRLSARLHAMARTHDLMTAADWREMDLAELLAVEAAPYEAEPGARIRMSGDGLRLEAQEAMAFGMLFHEMMTNAAKHGALSNADGRVEIDVTDGPPGDRRLVWRETGGPPVVDPGTARGFGSVVIERVFASDLGATVDLTFAPDGLVLTATF